MELLSERLLLRPLSQSDMNFLVRLEQNPLNQKYERDTIPSEDEIIGKYNAYLKTDTVGAKAKYYFIVKDQKGQNSIGKITLKVRRKDINEWEMGWAISPEYWGKGYAIEAARRVADFAFHELNARRIVAHCHADHRQSEAVMIKLGMQKEGIFRKVLYLHHEWNDQFIYSLFQEEL
ncbi:hypothetical protein PMSD_25230 [Paenibacillus macquariensis subsp. defensor]|nr:hypothetical protein PMSD_25230 [Paenibacillus macquariensis subsp. defensor]